ncbi:MAG: hypothetical protein CM15mP127_15360 [Gammaproteobacteria bacterium]|nr:MAG: hypothetical protein CM15mP127_15360 [Gammaproteobacteria bacterium]
MPTNVGAIPTTFYNLVNGQMSGESDELYHVYASTSPDVTPGAMGTDLIAVNVLEGSQATVHYLNYPLVDSDVSYYYAVVCEDAAGNLGELASTSSSVTNTARG